MSILKNKNRKLAKVLNLNILLNCEFGESGMIAFVWVIIL